MHYLSNIDTVEVISSILVEPIFTTSIISTALLQLSLSD